MHSIVTTEAQVQFLLRHIWPQTFLFGAELVILPISTAAGQHEPLWQMSPYPTVPCCKTCYCCGTLLLAEIQLVSAFRLVRWRQYFNSVKLYNVRVKCLKMAAPMSGHDRSRKEPSDSEDDPVENLISKTGCAKYHYAVQVNWQCDEETKQVSQLAEHIIKLLRHNWHLI